MNRSSMVRWAAVALALSAATALGACGGVEAGSPVAAQGLPAIVIDVRTPEEYAAGHLDGALNIDIQAADFDMRIGELDRDASYAVYCRSGNRSGMAVERMSELGFGDAVNAGSLEMAAESTGLAIVP